MILFYRMKIIFNFDVVNKLFSIKLFACQKNSVPSKCKCHEFLYHYNMLKHQMLFDVDA